MAGLNLFITGKPGVGKTTLVEQVVARLGGPPHLAGFTTTEVRDSAGQRLGFNIVTVEGRQGELARVGLHSRVYVGRYGVNLESFQHLSPD